MRRKILIALLVFGLHAFGVLAAVEHIHAQRPAC
jgi:hypothetical protein